MQRSKSNFGKDAERVEITPRRIPPSGGGVGEGREGFLIQ